MVTPRIEVIDPAVRELWLRALPELVRVLGAPGENERERRRQPHPARRLEPGGGVTPLPFEARPRR